MSDLCNAPSGRLAQSGGHVGLYEAGGGGFARVGWLKQTGLGRDRFSSYSRDGSLETLVTIGSVSLGDVVKHKATTGKFVMAFTSVSLPTAPYLG